MRKDIIQALSDRKPVFESIQDQIGSSSGRFVTFTDERMDVHVVGDYHDIVDEEMELNAKYCQSSTHQ